MLLNATSDPVCVGSPVRFSVGVSVFVASSVEIIELTANTLNSPVTPVPVLVLVALLVR
jgi:hypothetical protein